ncbi:MAG: acetate--CoA ligase family protein, partial [Akkermansiaceae bacterium]|nr:acetate--CoA ligase family protein [Akkermansiaceae bacterium]
MAFSSQPIPRGNRVGMITNTGGPAVIGTDVLVDAGLEIPALSGRAQETLKEVLFPEATIGNPTDVLATAGAEQFRAAIDVLMDEQQIDSILINFVTPFFVDTESIAREIAAVSRQRKKPIVCNLMTDRRQWSGVVEILRDGGVPSFSFPGEAARALVALSRYHQIRSREIGEVRQFDDVDRGRAAGILQGAREAGREFLTAAEAYDLLTAYGIPVAGWQVAGSAGEAVQAAAEIGFPVVVKADAESIVHKSDVGGVAVDLKDGDAVRSAVEAMARRLGSEGLRFFVQEYCPGGLEVIVGAKAEEGLGHLVMFGVGGIYVEVLKDVAFKLSPVTDVEARELLSSIKAAPLLDGVRGEQGVDKEGILDLIGRLSQLVTELPMIQEMDLNPIIAYADRVVVVDARVGL